MRRILRSNIFDVSGRLARCVLLFIYLSDSAQTEPENHPSALHIKLNF